MKHDSHKEPSNLSIHITLTEIDTTYLLVFQLIFINPYITTRN